MKKILLFATVALYVGIAIPPLRIQAADLTATEVATPRVLSLRVTAYTSVPDETDSTPFITASGELVRDGIVATNLLPFGTKVTIPALFGNKIFVVEDRMNERMKNSLDIWMQTKGKALLFGVHYDTDVLVVSTTTTAVALGNGR